MSGDLSGFSLFDLFKTEAEMHSAALSSGLLAIEQDPSDLSHAEQLMRAAHSIKGAARIIGLDVVVELAHAMEDCFVAVQNGAEVLNSARVDQLLAGVDVFQEISQIAESEVDAWLSSQATRLQQLAETLRHPAEAPPVAAPSVTAVSPEVHQEVEKSNGAETADEAPAIESASAVAAREPAKPMDLSADEKGGATAKTEQPTEQRTVPVNASNLNRIMRLASESMIEARQLQSMQRSLADMQEAQRNFAQVLEQVERTGGLGPGTQLDVLRASIQKSGQVLHEHARRLERALWKSERTSTALYHEVIASRMRPFAEGTQGFPRMIRDLSKSLGKQVEFKLVGGSVAVDRDILRKLEAPLNHILRNGVDHAMELPDERLAAGKPATGRITLEARHHAGMLTIEVRDDGRGIDVESLRHKIVERKLVDRAMAAALSHAEIYEFLFLPGFSTAKQVTEVSGRGVGLDVVRTMVHEVSGTLRVESHLGRGSCFSLHLPVTLSVIRAALAEIAGELYAFPLAKLERIVRVSADEIVPVQGRQQFMLDGLSVGLIRGTEIFELDGGAPEAETLSVIVVRQDKDLCGVVVERFIGEQDLVVRPLDPRLGKVPQISSAALTEEGEPLLIVDVEDLFHSMRQLLGEGRLRGMTTASAAQVKARRPKVLVVDDSITVREVERQLLSASGYDVDVAVDGQDGWHALRAGAYDLLVSDVDMPRMNGIELIKMVRQDPQLEQLPVIIVSYKDNEEDRLRGFEAGANAYLTKGSFHDNSFLRTVSDLIGELE